MPSAKVGLKNLGSIRPVAEAEKALRLCAAALVQRVQQVGSEFFGRDYRAIGVWNRHVAGSVTGGAVLSIEAGGLPRAECVSVNKRDSEPLPTRERPCAS